MTISDAVAGLRGPQRCEVGGIATWWEDAGGPTMHGALMFRVGVVDETAATHGITHLVEHLAMPVGVVRHMVDCNASVEATQTSFFADGQLDDVARFLTGVLQRLADLPVHRLELERRILLAEADIHQPSAVEMLAACRYGIQGLGLVAIDEDALHGLTADAVLTWAAERFCRENAVLLFTGPPPDLPVLLPSGRRHLLPPSPQLGPGRVKHDAPGNGVSLTLTGPRTPAFRMGCRILADRAEESLRFERGLGYAVSGDWLELADTIHGSFVGACLERDARAMAEGLLQIIDDVAENGPTAAELAADRATALRDVASPDPTARLVHAAVAELTGTEPLALADAVALAAQVTSQQVAAAVDAARATILLAAGDDVPLPSGFTTEQPPTSFPHPGTPFRMRRLFRPARMIVGEDAVTMTDGSGATSIRREDVVLLLRYADDGRALVGVDGTWFQLLPSAWRNGDELACMLEAFAPRQVHLALPVSLREVAEGAAD